MNKEYPERGSQVPVMTECGKIGYPDKKSAESKRNQLKRKGRKANMGGKLRIYPCPDCKHWHLTKRL